MGGEGILLNTKGKKTIMPIKKLCGNFCSSEYIYKVEAWEMGHKENSHEKVSQSLSFAHIACTHMQTHKHIHSTHTQRTHRHQVFTVLLLLML